MAEERESSVKEVNPEDEQQLERIDRDAPDTPGGAEPAEGADKDDGGDVEIDYSDGAAPPPAEPEREPEPEPTRDDAVLERLARFEADNNDLRAKLARIEALAPKESEELEDPEPAINSTEDIPHHTEWAIRKALRENRVHATLEASAVASEQRARGELSNEAMGTGRDYDTLVGRHMSEIERTSPAVRALIGSMRDPAKVRYGLSVIAHVTEKFKGDVKKAWRVILDAAEGRARGDAGVMEKIRQAEDRGARIASLKRTRGGPTAPRKITSEDIDKVPPHEWKAFKERLRRSGALPY